MRIIFVQMLKFIEPGLREIAEKMKLDFNSVKISPETLDLLNSSEAEVYGKIHRNFVKQLRQGIKDILI